MNMLEPILVTGVAGFVGGAVTNLLRSKGLSVVTHARGVAPGIDWVADLGDPHTTSIPFGIASVVHCAAAIPARSNAFARDNSFATAQLAAILAKIGALKRMVHISSVAVYERPPSGQWIISEDAEVVDVGDPSADPYARSKRASELALDAIGRHRPDIEITHLRASSIYGRGMNLATLLPALVSRALRDEPLRLYGPRNYRQNFVHVSDVVELAVALALGASSPSVINAFSDDTFGLSALAELICAGLGSHSKVVDDSHEADAPEPIFVNIEAKRLHPAFRRLADNLYDVA
jgi:nucleoside-diphosphate-sugar epimerase